jgi:hypothetical protein
VEGGAVVAEALTGHMANWEISVLREEIILLGARVRVIEDSLRSVRRNAPHAFQGPKARLISQPDTAAGPTATD